MVAIEEILWNVFTFYSLNGNPKDPSKLHSMGLLKFCKDILVMDNTMTEKSITQAELQLIYSSAIKSPEKIPANQKMTFGGNNSSHSSQKEKNDKIDFDSFLSCLIKIALKCYPSCENSEEAMQQLLMDNVLPLASRRKPISIALLLKQPNIDSLFKYYEDALLEIYKFYTVSADLRKKGNNMLKSTTHNIDVFDNEVELIEEAKLKAYRELSTSNKMSFFDFIRFANDFGLVKDLGLTTLDLGDLYLTVTYFTNFAPQLRRIDFKEFWECLVRCALVAFQEKKNLTTEVKIKGLFLSIWRHIQSSVQDHMKGYGTLSGGGFNTYKGALLRGTQPNQGAATLNSSSVQLLPNTLTSMLKPPEKSRSRTATGADITELQNEPSPKKKPSSQQTTDIDEITRDKLFRIADENVEQSDNFLVKTKNNRIIRIMISDYEEFEDERLQAPELRKLLYLKPSVAELLYGEMLEAGLVDEEPPSEEEEDEQDDLDSTSKPENKSQPIEDDDELPPPPIHDPQSPLPTSVSFTSGNSSPEKRGATSRANSMKMPDSKIENEEIDDEEDSDLHRMDSNDL